MSPRQEAAWLSRQRPATEWTRAGNFRGLPPKRKPTPGELERAMASYRAKPRRDLRADGWFDDVTWTRCVCEAMGEGGR